MTVEKALQLVIQAGALGQNGEVMILHVGEPVKIDNVARKLIEVSAQMSGQTTRSSPGPW